MKKFCIINIILIINLCLLIRICDSKDFNKNLLIKKFEKLDSAINNGNGYINYTNENGTLAWAQSPLLEAYLEVYQNTKDYIYIKKFIHQANHIIAKTDKERGIKDYKGRTRIGWSAIKYSKDKKTPLVHLLHTGMILYPLLKFCSLIKTDASLSPYSETANLFIQIAEEAISEFEDQWRFNKEKDEGCYWFEGDEPILTNLKLPMPLNHNLSIGRVILKLYKLTEKENYLKKCKALGSFFKKNIIETPKGSYIWGYRPIPYTFSQIEDISHGSIDVEFAIEMYRNSLIFNYEDMKKFVQTFISLKKDGKFFKYVNATDDLPGKFNPNAPGDLSDSIGRWLELSEFDCLVYKFGFEYFTNRIKNSQREHPQILLGLSKLIKYYDECK